MEKKLDPTVVLGVFCVVVGIMVVLLVTSGGGDDDGERARGEPAELLDLGAPATSTTTLAPSVLRQGVIDVPEYMRGVAVQVDFVAGIGGYAAPGDLVDVYATTDVPEPGTDLVLSNVLVLDVSAQVAPTIGAEADGPRASTGALTYLLAVNPLDVDDLVFNTRRADVYLALVPPDPSTTTTTVADAGS